MTGGIWFTTASSSPSSTITYDAYDHYRQLVLRQAQVAPPPVKHLKQDHSPNCCGCDFMSWFPQPDAFGMVKQSIVDQTKAQLEEHKARYNSMMLVILNNLQRPFYEEMLIGQGYKMIMGPTYHPGHGHNLYLYGYEKYDSKTLAPRR